MTIKDISTTCSRPLANLPVCIRRDLGRWQKYRDSYCFADEDEVRKMFKPFSSCRLRIAGLARGSIWIIIDKQLFLDTLGSLLLGMGTIYIRKFFIASSIIPSSNLSLLTSG